MDRRKLLTLVFIHVFVAIQIALPLHYYFLREDENDERFAWRMFSTNRMIRCQSAFVADGERIRLLDHFHEAWPRLVRRARLHVIERMALKLCDEEPDRDVRVYLKCRELGGETTTLADGDWNLCRVGEL